MTPASSLSITAFEKALYAAWAASWLAYVSAGHADVVETVSSAGARATDSMEDAKEALLLSAPGLSPHLDLGQETQSD